MSEKHFVFDSDGKLTEVRGYAEGVVNERYEIVYGENDEVVGIRPLNVEDVMPQSWVDKFKRLWRKPKPLAQILSIDFIGLIQYINTINKIKTIENIENIKNIESIDLIDKITLIDEITKIGEVTALRDVQQAYSGLILNSSFEQGLVAWYHSGTGADVELSTLSKYGDYSCKFPASKYTLIRQNFPIAIGVNWISELYVWLRATATGNCLNVTYQYTDTTNSAETLNLASSDTWTKKTLSPTAGKYIEAIWFYHSDAYAMVTLLDDITMVI